MPITTNTYPLFEHQEEGSSRLDDDSTLYQNSCPLKKVESKSTHTNVLSSKKQKRWFLFKKISYIVVMNAIIPIALYYILKSHLPAVWALVLSTTPTIISVIIQAIFLKRIDSIGVAVIFGTNIVYIQYATIFIVIYNRLYSFCFVGYSKWGSKVTFDERVLYVISPFII